MFVPAKIVHISEKSIKQKAIKPKYWNKMVLISEKSIYPAGGKYQKFTTKYHD